MAAQVGTVEVPVEIVLTGQALRLKALELGVQLVSTHQGFRAPQDSALSAAREFEKYLAGGES